MRTLWALAAASMALLPTGDAASVRGDALLAADRGGGHWLVWREVGSGGDQLRVTRLDPAGDVRPGWAATGIVVGDTPGARSEPSLAADERDGVWIAWSDRRSGPRRVHVTRLEGDGRTAVADREVGAAGLEDFRPALIATPEGGVLVAWQSWNGRDSDVRVQRLTARGRVETGWPAEGLAVADAPFDECLPAWSSGHGSAVLDWIAYDGEDPGRGVARAARLSPREPRVMWRGLRSDSAR